MNPRKKGYTLIPRKGNKVAQKQAEGINSEILRLTPYFLQSGIPHNKIPKPITAPSKLNDEQYEKFQDTVETVSFHLQALMKECDTKEYPPAKPNTENLSLDTMQVMSSTPPTTIIRVDIELLKKANRARQEILNMYKERCLTPPDYLAKEINIPTQSELDAIEDPETSATLNLQANGSLVQFSMLRKQLLDENQAASHFDDNFDLIISPSTPDECREAIRRVNKKHDQIISRLNIIGIPPKEVPKKMDIANYNLNDETQYPQINADLIKLMQLLAIEFAPISKAPKLKIVYTSDQINQMLSVGILQEAIDENTPTEYALCALIDNKIRMQHGNDVKLVGNRPYVKIINNEYHFFWYFTPKLTAEQKPLVTAKQPIKTPAAVIKPKPAPAQPAPKKQPKRRVIKEEKSPEVATDLIIATSSSSSSVSTNPALDRKADYNNELHRAQSDVKETFFQIELNRAENERDVIEAYLNEDNHPRLGAREQYEVTEEDDLFVTLQSQKTALERLASMLTSDEEVIANAKTILQQRLQAFETTCVSIKAKLTACNERLAQIKEQIRIELIEADKAAAKSRYAINDDDDEPSIADTTNNNAQSNNSDEAITVESPQPSVALEKKSTLFNTTTFIGMNLKNTNDQPKKVKKKNKPAQNAAPKHINPLALDLKSFKVEESLASIDLLYDKYTKHCTAYGKQGVFDTTSAIAMIDLEGLALNVFETLLKFQQRSGLSLFENKEDAATCRNASKYCFHWFIFKMENTTNKADYNTLNFIQFIRSDVKKALSSLMYGKGEFKINATHPEMVKTRKALENQNATTTDIAVLNARFSTLISFMETILKEHHKQDANSQQKHERVYALSFLLALVGVCVKNAIEINSDNKAYQLKTSHLQPLLLAEDETKTSSLLEGLTGTEIQKLLIDICNEKSHENKSTWLHFKPLQARLTLILTNFIVNKANQLRSDCFTVPEPKLPVASEASLSTCVTPPESELALQNEAPLFSERAMLLLSTLYQANYWPLLNRINQDFLFSHIVFALNCIKDGNDYAAMQSIDLVLAGNNMECFKNQYLWDTGSRQLFDNAENLLLDVNEAIQAENVNFAQFRR